MDGDKLDSVIRPKRGEDIAACVVVEVPLTRIVGPTG